MGFNNKRRKASLKGISKFCVNRTVWALGKCDSEVFIGSPALLTQGSTSTFHVTPCSHLSLPSFLKDTNFKYVYNFWYSSYCLKIWHFVGIFCVETTDCKTPSPPNPIGSGCHIRRQERSICSDWSEGATLYSSHLLLLLLHLHLHLHLLFSIFNLPLLKWQNDPF